MLNVNPNQKYQKVTGFSKYLILMSLLCLTAVIGLTGCADISTFPDESVSEDAVSRELIQVLPKLPVPIPRPCGIHLSGLNQTRGYAGEVIQMFGTWGTTQGVKVPAINKGTLNELIVIEWTNTVLTVRIPAGLAPGDYRIGVYCNPLSWGSAYSSGWMDFEIRAPLVLIKQPRSL